jgi:hypothetical protein
MIRLIKIIVKECFWLICAAAIIVIGWSVFFLPFSRISNFEKLWENLVRGGIRLSNELLQGDSLATTLILIPLALIYLVRLIIWIR